MWSDVTKVILKSSPFILIMVSKNTEYKINKVPVIMVSKKRDRTSAHLNDVMDADVCAYFTLAS